MATTKKVSNKKTSTKATKSTNKVEDQFETNQRAVFNSINEGIDSAQLIAKKAYLAYLGVVGRTVEEVQTRYTQANEDFQSRFEKISQNRENLMEELVSRGEQVQDDASELLKESRANIEEQIETAKKRLGGLVSVVDIPSRLQEVSDRLESLSKDLKKSA